MKKTILAATVAILALLIAGCAEATEDTSPKAGSNASVAPEPAPAEEETPEPEEQDGTLRFGETVNYDDGLSITIGKPQAWTPPEYASYDEDAPAQVKFKVTIVNGAGKPYHAIDTYITVQSGDVEAEQGFDGEKVGQIPDTAILAGRQATYWVGFGVQSSEDLVMEVSSLTHESVIFTNAAGA